MHVGMWDLAAIVTVIASWLRYRGRSLDLRLTRDALTVRRRDGAAPPLTLCFDGEACDFASGTIRVFR